MDECPICLEENAHVKCKNDCNKMFHPKCIEEWLQKSRTCPSCTRPWSFIDEDSCNQIVIIDESLIQPLIETPVVHIEENNDIRHKFISQKCKCYLIMVF